MNAWLLLGGAIALEICATTLLKLSNGFSRPVYGIASMALYSVCFWMLAFAFTRIPVGVAYALWSGIGIFAMAAIGYAVFRQPLTVLQIGFMALILVGAVGLSLATPAGSQG
jgi:small multidrug resistance pump